LITIGYQERKKIENIHPDWGEEEISDKIEREKDPDIRKISMNVNWFAQDTIKEMEKLLDDLNQSIAKGNAHNL
jgi:hypothetical protein